MESCKPCVVCGCNYIPEPRNRWRAKYCSKKCYYSAAVKRRASQNRINKPSKVRVCNFCIKKFLPDSRAHRLARCCSTKCSRNLWRSEHRIQARLATKLSRLKYIIRIRKKERLGSLARRAKLKQVKGNFAQSDWDYILQSQNYRCWWCGNQFPNLSVDHVIPLSKNGKHDRKNIVGACIACNSAKRDRLWAPSIGKLFKSIKREFDIPRFPR